MGQTRRTEVGETVRCKRPTEPGFSELGNFTFTFTSPDPARGGRSKISGKRAPSGNVQIFNSSDPARGGRSKIHGKRAPSCNVQILTDHVKECRSPPVERQLPGYCRYRLGPQICCDGAAAGRPSGLSQRPDAHAPERLMRLPVSGDQYAPKAFLIFYIFPKGNLWGGCKERFGA